MTAEVKTHPGQRGTLRKVVTVTTDDPVARTVQLFVTVRVQPGVEVLPSPQLIVRLAPGETARRTVRLRRTDGEVLEVTPRPVAPGAPVAVEVQPRSEGVPPSEAVVRLRIGPANPPLRRTVLLEFATNHPRVPTTKLRVTVIAERTVEASPPRVTLGRGSGGALMTSAVVRLRATHGRPFAVKRATTDRPELLEVSEVTSGRNTVHTIRVALRQDVAANPPRGLVLARLDVETDEPGTPQLSVPVVIGSQGPKIPRRLTLPRPPSSR